MPHPPQTRPSQKVMSYFWPGDACAHLSSKLGEVSEVMLSVQGSAKEGPRFCEFSSCHMCFVLATAFTQPGAHLSCWPCL